MHFVDTFYQISFPMQKNKLLNKAAFVWNKLIRQVLRRSYPAYCRRHPLSRGVSDRPREPELIVSLTSFPQRMQTIEPTIQSLLRQTLKPDRLFLWLSKEQFPDERIPAVLVPFLDAGLEVRFVEDDLKPHKKSFYTAQLFPDSIIITVDDDIIYGESVVQRLAETYRECDKKTVVCELGHEILLGEDGLPKSYDKWNWESLGLTGPSYLLMPKGAGGVLYPPGFFTPDYFDVEAIRESCLMGDDLWLKFMGLLHGFPVKKTRAYPRNVYSSSELSQKFSLANVNNGEGRNNLYLSNLIARFSAIDWTHLQ